jgi:uncharacterized protein
VSTLDNFRKEAKRWLKALRAGDPGAQARLKRTYPQAPAEPGLRAVQHALALEHGAATWQDLKAGVRPGSDQGQTGVRPDGAASHAERVTRFLQFACWDHHTHGKADHRMYDRAAQRILAQHPDIARDSIYTAIVCGDVEEVTRILAARPDAAREAGGPRGWTPILYLAFTRFTHPATIAHALEIARLLLDHGANPNDFYMAGDSEYTALVGAAGEGEQDSPRQPYAEALYRLLLERGAGPYDIQVLYDTHFSGDMLWWLELTYQHSLSAGRKADWDDPDWAMLDMGGYGSGAHFVLKIAVRKNDLTLAEWALTRGASPNANTSSHPKFRPKHTLYDVAVLAGQIEMAALLRRHGATAGPSPLDPDEQFLAACLRLDRPAAETIAQRHPELLRAYGAMFEAAKRDRPDVIALLLDLGIPLEVEDRHKARALHHAAANNARHAAAFLIARGAEIDPRETSYNATPIGWAAHGDRLEMIELLSRYSRNVWTLAFRGYVDRLREILRATPDLAKQVASDGTTPLWWLPDEEDKALAIVELLLAAGADPAIRNRQGRTAADWARTRGMTDVARRLEIDDAEPSAAQTPVVEAPMAPSQPDLARYEGLAQDLVLAHDTGDAASMGRLTDHFGGEVTWDELRAAVAQRLDRLEPSEKPRGPFALPHAQLLVAREAGFDNWAELHAMMSGSPASPPTRPIVAPPLEPADVPIEMRSGFEMRLYDNIAVPTADVWDMLAACRDGHLGRVKALVEACPSLVLCEYNYMPPIHLAVREGHLDIVRYLADRGAVNPKYLTYPYNETLITLATDRGYDDIARMLEERSHDADPDRPGEESGHIEYETDVERRRFQRLVGANRPGPVETLLRQRPELALDPYTFWSEGVLMMPANRRNREMLELLLRYGARVPAVSKWGPAYYFKHEDIAALLLERGMSATHMNCHRTTLLHEMARLGEIGKARLLLNYGADINAVDQEFRSTPLGFAARWGQRSMVAFLLERGADRARGGAPWATPLAWARKKGHADIARDL